MWISPAAYHWILPSGVMGMPISNIVDYAEAGKFPVVEEILYPALGYAALFGFARLLLTKVAFRVSNLDTTLASTASTLLSAISLLFPFEPLDHVFPQSHC